MAQLVTRWLAGPRFDVPWLFGGAALSLLAAVVAIRFPDSIHAIWWVWLLAFDGPHMMAAYTRTYLDKQAWRQRRGLLLGSLVCFAVGPTCLALNLLLDAEEPFLLYLAVATAYGYHHIVRQHYGFVALYKSKAGQRNSLSFKLDRWALYAGCWIPYLYFLVSHPKARALIGLDEAPLPILLTALLAGGWLLSLALVLFNFRRTADGQRSIPKLAYLLLTIVLHGFAYLIVGRFEPVYAASSGPDQDFLLLSVVLTIFHNVQYVALVYLHNRSRYRAGAHGAASWLSRNLLRYAAVCLAFAVVYLAMAGLTGVFPGFVIAAGSQLGPFRLGQWGLALWWGLALHHYLLDQYIWRIRDDPELRQHLRLQQTATP